MVASRLIKREKGSLPVDVRGSKTSLLKLPNGLYGEASPERGSLLGLQVYDLDKIW